MCITDAQQSGDDFLPAFRNPRRVAFSIKHQSSGGFALEGNKLEKQTEAKIQLQHFESTVSEYAFVSAELKLLYDQRDRALFTILKYMEQENAKFLRTPTHDVVIPLKRKYLPEKFQSVMGEYLSPEQFGEAFIPEHTETVTVKAKVNGNVVKKWWDMGDEMVEKLMLTLDPAQKREITLKPIKKEIGM